jgi:predicted metal-binding protein
MIMIDGKSHAADRDVVDLVYRLHQNIVKLEAACRVAQAALSACMPCADPECRLEGGDEIEAAHNTLEAALRWEGE